MGQGRVNKSSRIEKMEKERRDRAIAKFKQRLARKKLEAKDPEAKRIRREKNIPKTIDNMRAYDPSMVTLPPNQHPDNLPVLRAALAASDAQPEASSSSAGPQQPAGDIDAEHAADIANDPFADYFQPDPESERDPTVPPRVLITTSPYATAVSWAFCDELVGVFPGAEFFKRRKGGSKNKVPPLGTLAGWAVKRGYSSMIIVNEDHKQPNALTFVHLPEGPTAYFKLTSIQLSREISGHARASPHYPELVLNNFVTRLGHAIGRMFQTLFPPMPEFEGRQVVTLHNQRDFMFFRRHRYMFKSTEKTALQEIGPRFTLRLRSIRNGIPQNNALGAPIKPLEITQDEREEDETIQDSSAEKAKASQPRGKKPADGEYAWSWNPKLELNKRTFFI